MTLKMLFIGMTWLCVTAALMGMTWRLHPDAKPSDLRSNWFILIALTLACLQFYNLVMTIKDVKAKNAQQAAQVASQQQTQASGSFTYNSIEITDSNGDTWIRFPPNTTWTKKVIPIDVVYIRYSPMPGYHPYIYETANTKGLLESALATGWEECSKEEYEARPNKVTNYDATDGMLIYGDVSIITREDAPEAEKLIESSP